MTKEEQAKIYEEYSDKIYYYILGKVSDSYAAEDLTSQVFLKMVEKSDTYNAEKSSVSTWIYTIAKNTVIDYYRIHKITSELDEDIEDAKTAEDEIIEKENLEELANALEQLEQRERTIIVLYYYDGLQLKEISQKLKISYSMTKLLHKRALDKLKELL